MSFALLPTLRAASVTELTPEMLSGRGIQLLMLDFDNTIVPYTTDTPSKEMTAWLEKMQRSDVRLCVVSNSRKSRVKKFCDRYGLDCITHARKPGGYGIRRCMEKYDLPPIQCALAGDQIYTDTLGGNLTGISTILVDAIDNHTIWLKLRHVAELPFRFAAEKRRIPYEKSE